MRPAPPSSLDSPQEQASGSILTHYPPAKVEEIELAPVTLHWQGSDGATLQVTVRWNRRRRRRLGFEFDPAGGIHVDAPPDASLEDVRRVLGRNAAWLAGRSQAAANAKERWYPAAYVDGATLLFRGREVTLRTGRGEAVRLVDAATLVGPVEATKAAVWDWFGQQAEAVLGQAVDDAVAGLDWLPAPPPWRQRYMTSRWGSCSSRGRITLNTHLAKLAPALAAYVVHHELCHLRHMDHGPGFYALLAESVPDWRCKRREVRRHDGLLREPRP